MNRTYGTRRLVVLVTGSIFLMSSLATAAPPKVVVVPLGGSKVAGTNGQLQYNDDGKIAGAEVHYDKSTGVLEVKGEIRSTDYEGTNRLWGEGRPGVSVPIWSPETTKGFKQGRSNQVTGWENSAAGCPKATWVCTMDDWDHTYNLGDKAVRYNYEAYNSEWLVEKNYIYAWLSDKGGLMGIEGKSVYTSPHWRQSLPAEHLITYKFRPLCCKTP